MKSTPATSGRWTMRREGSPWTGLWAVVLKELADHLSSVRMQLLELLIFLTAFAATFVASRQLRATVAEDPFVYLKLFTTQQDPLPSFVAFLGFFLPLAAIALGFDSVNGEHNRRTLSRVLAQPIYRDALLLGKFLAGIVTLGISLLSWWLLVSGIGLLVRGVAPSGPEVARGLLFLLSTLAYAGIWLALALMFSVVFRQPATSALAAMAVWLFFAVFWDIMVQVAAQALRPAYGGGPFSALAPVRLGVFLSPLSPQTPFSGLGIPPLQPQGGGPGAPFITQ